MGAAALPPSPYKGLMPYDEGDARFFFGRDTERDIIIANLTAARLTLLYGASGVGKSSVLRAGVVHALQSEARGNLAQVGAPELAVVYFNSWRDDPLRGLLGTVEAAVRGTLSGYTVEPPAATDFIEALAGWSEVVEGPLLIILDQFEEYFLYHGQEEGPATFAVEFPQAVSRRDLRVNFLVALREDALARLDRFKGRIPGLFENRLRIDHLDRAAAEAAIRRPLDEWNAMVPSNEAMTIEDSLVEAVLEQVKRGEVVLGDAGRGQVATAPHDARIETPFLQLVMTRLWDEERRQGSRVLRLQTLERLGGAGSIVRTHLDAAMQALSPAERDLAARIFHHLVTPSGAKIAHTVSDLAVYADAPVGDVLPVLERLSRGDVRILRPIAPPPDTPGEPRYEIYHDVLAPAILDWRARYQREADRAETEAKLAAEQKRVNRLRLGLLGVTVLLLLVGALAVFALNQWQRAGRAETEAVKQRDAAEEARGVAAQQRDLAEAQRAAAVQAQATAEAAKVAAETAQRINQSRELAASSLERLPVDPELSLLLAIEANDIQRTAQAEDALRRSLPESYVRRVLRGPPSAVWTAAYSPDDRRIVTARADRIGEIWDAVTGERVAELRGHTDVVNQATFSPDGQRIVTASDDGTARVWDAATGQPLAVIRDHTRGVYQAVFSPDGRLIATSSKDGTARLSDAQTGRGLYVLPSQGGEVTSAAFSPDGQYLVATSLDTRDSEGASRPGTARVWRVATGEQVAELGETAYGGVWGADFSRDGKRLVTASEDNTARVWEVGSWRKLYDLLGHSGRVSRAVFSPDSKLILTASADLTARLWDAASGQSRSELAGHTAYVLDGNFSPDGKSVVTTSLDGAPRLWDTDKGRELAVLRGHTAGVFSGTFDHRGQSVLTSSGDGTARIWEARTRPSLHELQGHTQGLTGLDFSGDGRRLATASEDGTARIWDTDRGDSIATLRGHRDVVRSVALNSDGSRAVTASNDGTARVWDAGTGRQLAELRHGQAVNKAVFSPDGQRVVTASNDGTARVWDTETGRQLAELAGHTDAVTSAAFSPDGRRIVTGSDDMTARLWQDNGSVVVLDGPTKGLNAVAFSPDGQLVAAMSNDWKGYVWDATTGQRVAQLIGHTGPPQTLAFSPDGESIVTTSGWPDYTARVWQARTGRQLAELTGHTNLVHSAVFHPSGRWIVTASEDHTTRVWEGTSGKNLAVLRGHVGGVAAATFSPDGRLIAAAGNSVDDPTAHLYICDVCNDLDTLLQQARSRVTRSLTAEERAAYLSRP